MFAESCDYKPAPPHIRTFGKEKKNGEFGNQAGRRPARGPNALGLAPIPTGNQVSLPGFGPRADLLPGTDKTQSFIPTSQ